MIDWMISVDPSSTSSGVALWLAGSLSWSWTLRRRDRKGGPVWTLSSEDRTGYQRREAWQHLLTRPGSGLVVAERSSGQHANSIDAIARERGYIQAMADVHGVAYVEIPTSEWRRVVKEEFATSWPAGRDAIKSHAVRLVERRYARRVPDDEAEAILIGMAAMRAGYAEFRRA